MKPINLFSKLTNKPIKRSKKIACAALIALFVIFNLDQSIETTQRLLSEEEEFLDFHDEDLNEGEEIPYLSRFLSKSLGGGKCLWTAPEELERHETENTTTLLASYPGSGKR